jgi:two-component system sensor histidine kinase KdpD
LPTDQISDFELMLDRFAHSLRSPLTSIKGAASVLEQTEVEIDEDSKKELISIISQEAARLDKTIEKLLWIIRIESKKIELNYKQENLGKLIDSLVKRMSAILNNHLLKIDISKTLPLIEIDREFIEKALFYLLENASKYSSAGSEINISAKEKEDKIVIFIVDKGCGIPLEKQKEIFDKMYKPSQEPNQIPSVGMSLAICRGLIELHKGKISLQSQVRQGTTVSIELPITRLKSRAIS